MNIGIYKPGQGYWVRVMTAVFAGIIVLAAAAWVWNELAIVHLPTPRWDLTLATIDGSVEQDQEVTLRARVGSGAGVMTDIGAGMIEAFTSRGEDAGSVIVGSLEMTSDPKGKQYDPSLTESVTSSGFQAQVLNRRGVPIFEQIYLQAAGAGVIMLVGSIFLYWVVGVNRKSVGFLIATDGEMKKVNWSTRRDIIGSTWVVIAACILIAAVLFSVDMGFSNFFKLIGVLEQ